MRGRLPAVVLTALAALLIGGLVVALFGQDDPEFLSYEDQHETAMAEATFDKACEGTLAVHPGPRPLDWSIQKYSEIVSAHPEQLMGNGIDATSDAPARQYLFEWAHRYARGDCPIDRQHGEQLMTAAIRLGFPWTDGPR